MSFPDTIEQELELQLRLLQAGVQQLEAETDDPDGFYAAAAARARDYAAKLQRRLDTGGLVYRQLIEEAALVAKASAYGGWLTASGVDDMERDSAAMARLVRQGVFALFEQVPGRYVACYRLVAP